MADHLRHSRLFSRYHDLSRVSYSETMTNNFDSLREKLAEQVESIARDLHAVVVPQGGIPEAARAPAIAEELTLGVELAENVLQNAQLFLRDLNS